MIRFLLVIFSVGLIGNNLQAQSPGGVSVNNKMWLRGDNGVTTTGTTVTQWQEASGANVTGNFTVQPLAGTTNTQTGPTFLPVGVNFNPYVSFDGITNSLSSVNNFLGTALVSNSNVTVFQVLNLKSGIVWLKWETDFSGTTARLGFENSSGRLRFDFPKAVPASAGQNVGVTNILNQHTLSTCYANTTTSVNRLNGADDNPITLSTPGNFAAATTKIVLGNENLLNLPCKIDLAEVIIYSNTLTAAERNRVESYLAVKYGFTLNQLAANNNNYVASNSTITWDRAANSTYANNITGIGRDDATALSQKQSKSINSAALVTLYNGVYASGNFPVDNASNTNTFSNDLSFLITGDNGGTTALDQCALSGAIHRMQRIWKASKTGSFSDVTIAVDQSSVPTTTTKLLVSANPAFPGGATSVYTLTAANGKLFTNVTLNHNDYFTFASDSTPTPQLQAADVCVNTNGTATVVNPTAGLTYNWYSQSVGGVLIGTGTSITIPNLLNDTTIYVETVSALGCILPNRVPVTIRVQSTVAPAFTTTQTTCTVSTGSITITSPTGAGYQYCINGANCQTGLTFSNLSPNTYNITAINALGCVSPITTVTINAPPPLPTAPTVVSPVLICANQSTPLTVTNPIAGNTYTWYSSATGGTALGMGTTFTTPILSSATTFYVETTNAQGCTSPTRTSVDVQLRSKLPTPIVSVSNITDTSMLFSWAAIAGADGYLVSIDGINYIAPNSGINGTTHLLTGLLPNTNYTLYVQAINSAINCITSNDGSATAKTLPRYFDIYVPGAFTPNGDNINNTLKVFGDIKSYQFRIFNRYGQLVFATTTLNKGWDGTFKGAKQSSGTYVWHVTALLANGRRVDETGTSILLR
ncbi:MAG: gliding motility-associated C-terminal domain-containing protein [Ferruginibacter sp.]|nr:gliding motility-associated C-terminal domain-containing protein [Ferruginibacter sp.]